MHRLNDYYEETIAGHYLPAMINDDYSGLSDDEADELNAFMVTFSALPDLTISVVDDESQFAVDAVSGLHADCYTVRFYFTNYERAHFGGAHST